MTRDIPSKSVPQGAQAHVMPAKLAVNGQQHRKLSVRVFCAGGAQRLLDACNIRRGEPGFLDFIGQVQIFGHAHVLRRPRREGKMTGRLVIVKLYAADALVKEPTLLLHAGQRLHDMILPGQCVLPQEGIGNMLCICQTVQLAAGVRSNAQLGMQLRTALGQAFQQQRVELPALPVQDHLYRGVVVERFLAEEKLAEQAKEQQKPLKERLKEKFAAVRSSIRVNVMNVKPYIVEITLGSIVLLAALGSLMVLLREIDFAGVIFSTAFYLLCMCCLQCEIGRASCRERV